MTGIYNFYITTDLDVVRNSANPMHYDRLYLEAGREVWIRTERINNPRGTAEQTAVFNEPRPGEQFLGTVEV